MKVYNVNVKTVTTSPKLQVIWNNIWKMFIKVIHMIGFIWYDWPHQQKITCIIYDFSLFGLIVNFKKIIGAFDLTYTFFKVFWNAGLKILKFQKLKNTPIQTTQKNFVLKMPGGFDHLQQSYDHFYKITDSDENFH